MDQRRIHETIPDALIGLFQTIGEDIAAARKVRKWSQADLAEHLNLSRKTVSAMEKGDVRVSFGAYGMAAWVMGLEHNLLGIFAPQNDPVFQREARLDLPKRVRAKATSELGDLDF